MTLKNRLICFGPLAVGCYCLIQGSALAMNADPLAQIVGFGLVVLPVPSCAYFFWRGIKELSPRVAAAEPVQEQAMPEVSLELAA